MPKGRQILGGQFFPINGHKFSINFKLVPILNLLTRTLQGKYLKSKILIFRTSDIYQAIGTTGFSLRLNILEIKMIFGVDGQVTKKRIQLKV